MPIRHSTLCWCRYCAKARNEADNDERNRKHIAQIAATYPEFVVSGVVVMLPEGAR